MSKVVDYLVADVWVKGVMIRLWGCMLLPWIVWTVLILANVSGFHHR